MRVLIACEFSGRVRQAFRDKGHDAWSCDLRKADDRSKYHCRCDARELLDLGWDLLIAHPPCTYLCVPGAHYLNTQEGRIEKMLRARDFFMTFWEYPIPKICVENPVPHKKARLPRYSQIISPYMFGECYSKRTCLWLKGLPLLEAIDIKEFKGDRYIRKDGSASNSKWYAKSNARERSITFSGIAKAMAEQWG